MVDQVVSDGTAEARARDWIDPILQHPKESIRGVLEIIRQAHVGDDLDRNTERDVFAKLWGGEAHIHALGGVKAGG